MCKTEIKMSSSKKKGHSFLTKKENRPFFFNGGSNINY